MDNIKYNANYILQLMPRLNETISSNNDLEQYRSLLILQQVIKALASKRLPSDRRVFQVKIDSVIKFSISRIDVIIIF